MPGPGWKHDETVLLWRNVHPVSRLFRGSGAKTEQPQLATGEALRLGMEIIDPAQQAIEACEACAVITMVCSDRDVRMRGEVSTVSISHHLEFVLGDCERASARFAENIGCMRGKLALQD